MVFGGGGAKALAENLKRQLERNTAWPRDLRLQVNDEIEHLYLRHFEERRTGKQFGEEQEGLCAWYALSSDPETFYFLRSVDLSDDGQVSYWVPGGRWAQPCRLLDAADVIRSAHNRISSESMNASRQDTTGDEDTDG